jgi:hypothetical protein
LHALVQFRGDFSLFAARMALFTGMVLFKQAFVSAMNFGECSGCGDVQAL